MTIRIEDLDKLDFSDVTTGGILPPIHPGEILREEFLIPLAITAHALALALKVPASRINDIVLERRAITPDTALRLARYFGTTADFWLNLQTAYDLRVAKQQRLPAIEREVFPREAA
jgi:antitoxin HigA-1